MNHKTDARYTDARYQLLKKQLRAMAEAKLTQIELIESFIVPPDQILHELHIHQIELEMQNEELRRVQKALEESRDRYEDLYEFSPMGYLTLNESGMITEINFTACDMLGSVRHKLLNRRFSRFISAEDNDTWYQHLKNGKRNCKSQDKILQHCELNMVRTDGATFYALLECLPIFGSTETPVWRVTLNDISELKKTRDELIEARKQADIANAFKSEFLISMSHEIRTLLNAISCSSHLFWNTELAEEQQVFLNNIDSAAHFLLDAITPITEISQIKTELVSDDVNDSNIVDIFKSKIDSELTTKPLLNVLIDSTCLIGRRILLVEDNEPNQKIMMALLKNMGIDVVSAANGLEAVNRIKLEHFDLVLLDLQMPIMDGLTATQEIRRDVRFAKLPIIALTAIAAVSEKDKNLAVGLNDYLTKPIEYKKLTETLCFWLQ